MAGEASLFLKQTCTGSQLAPRESVTGKSEWPRNDCYVSSPLTADETGPDELFIYFLFPFLCCFCVLTLLRTNQGDVLKGVHLNELRNIVRRAPLEGIHALLYFSSSLFNRFF